MLQTGIVQVVDHGFVHIIYATLNRSDDASATDNNRQSLYIYAFAGKFFLYQFLTPLKLVEDRGKLREFLRRVYNRLGERRLIVVINGDLCRCRAGIDCKNFITHT